MKMSLMKASIKQSCWWTFSRNRWWREMSVWWIWGL